MFSSYKGMGAVLVLCLGCFSVGRFLGPKSVQIKEVEKVVYKETGEKKIVEHTVETKHPDGTVVKDTTKTTESKKQKDLKSDSEVSKLTSTRNEYIVTGFGTFTRQNTPPMFGLMVSKRLFSEVYVGAFATNQHHLGISITLGF